MKRVPGFKGNLHPNKKGHKGLLRVLVKDCYWYKGGHPRVLER